MGWVVKATPRPLYPRERPGTHCTGGWVGPRACVDGCGKSDPPPPPGFDSRTFQPVTSRYTDFAVRPVHWFQFNLYPGVIEGLTHGVIVYVVTMN
jgi:hypothetical protein